MLKKAHFSPPVTSLNRVHGDNWSLLCSVSAGVAWRLGYSHLKPCPFTGLTDEAMLLSVDTPSRATLNQTYRWLTNKSLRPTHVKGWGISSHLLTGGMWKNLLTCFQSHFPNWRGKMSISALLVQAASFRDDQAAMTSYINSTTLFEELLWNARRLTLSPVWPSPFPSSTHPVMMPPWQLLQFPLISMQNFVSISGPLKRALNMYYTHFWVSSQCLK